MKKRIGYRAKDSISEGGATGSWGARAKFKMKKLLKIGEKQSKISSSSKIGEVRTRPVKALQNQKVNKSAKKMVATKGLSKKSLDIVNKYKKTSPSNLVEIPAKNKVYSHPGLGGRIVDKPRPDASLQRAINDWKKKKGKK